MSALLAMVAQFFAGLFKAWLGEEQRTKETEKAGALGVQVAQGKADDAQVAKALDARDAAVRLPDNPADFRD